MTVHDGCRGWFIMRAMASTARVENVSLHIPLTFC